MLNLFRSPPLNPRILAFPTTVFALPVNPNCSINPCTTSSLALRPNFFPQPQLHPEIQSLLDGHVREKGHVLLDERRGELGVARDRRAVDVPRAVQTHPGGILDPARQGVDQGGFSGAGRTHNGEHPSRPRLSPDGSVQYDTILLLLLLLFQRHANVRETYLHILEESAIHARIILNDDFLLVLLFVVVRAELHHLPPRMRRLRYE
mmetsp:Transcript_23137/g.68260  ORF Transcript_23137/g.68260 Transcript_23137/m.68260 type:complete len:206 (-) Transcript_23137:813-1430(-)